MKIYKIRTEEEIIKNKNIDYRLYCAWLFNSSYNVECDYRYTYTQNFYNNLDYFLEQMQIERVTFNRLNRKFLKQNILLGLDNTEYIFLDTDKNFVLLDKQEIDKLLECSNNSIKAYLVIRYTLLDKQSRDIELRYIAEKIGMSTTNYEGIRNCIKQLADKRLIKIKNRYVYDVVKNINKKIYKFELIN